MSLKANLEEKLFQLAPTAKKIKLDTVWTYAATEALKNFTTNIHDYRSMKGGTVARMCLEDARYAARIFSDIAHFTKDFQSLDGDYESATKSRSWLTVTNMSQDDLPIELNGVSVMAKLRYHVMLQRQMDRYQRQFDAKQVTDLPDKHLPPQKWLSERWSKVEAWMTLQEGDYFHVNRMIDQVYQAWPWDQLDSSPFFERLLLSYGIPYMCHAWTTIQSQPTYWALVIQHQTTLDRRDLESCMRVRTEQDLHDYAPLWSHPEDYLLHIISREDDPTPEIVQAWCKKYDRVLNEDMLRAIFVASKRGISGTMIQLLMKFGYLPLVEHYFDHYLRRWGMRK